jgi:serine-type D-Ala-D-Ala carboxypeptidase/endopeptidase (penicillin-binding protein 4)
VRRLPAVPAGRQALNGLVLWVTLGVASCTADLGTPAGLPAVATPPSPRASASPTSDPAGNGGRFEVSHESARGSWVDEIDRAIGSLDVSVAVGIGHRIVYEHRGDTPRVLASNEKLLTSMAALQLLGPSFRFPTRAAADGNVRHSVLRGDLWLVGGGDPTLTADDLARLAVEVRDAGIIRVTGDLVGDTAAFDRGWWAPGWLRDISRQYVTRPTALRLDGGDATPELEAAAAFRSALTSVGVTVAGTTRIGAAPKDLREVAGERSPALHSLLVHQNHESDNLYAELTTKELGSLRGDPSTAGGAAVVQGWARRLGVPSNVRDGSGLSDQDRTSAVGVVTLLLAAHQRPWFPVLERSLPTGGEGTLSGRLIGVPVHAKTGTLFIRPASTLSGYVKTQAGTTVAFSVLTHDLPEGDALRIEDAVGRVLAAAEIR